ncbi:arsenite methyltransferase [Leptothoe sp. LEGE 181152]|nr:arsenite methyltransferase [Leptothoe sp. LEGE 181152]
MVDDIRQKVAEAYTQALNKETANSDTSDSDASSEQLSFSVNHEALTKVSGYRDEQSTESHQEAAGSSFGCGNPVAFSAIKPGQTVLDLGSGAGLDLLLLAEKVGHEGQVIGVDMTDAMLRLAQTNIDNSPYKNIQVLQGYIEDLPLKNNSVDWIVSNCVINLSPEKNKVFQEMVRVLKPGGQFSVSDMIVEQLPQWMRADLDMYFACVAGAITENDYIKGLEQAGFGDVRVDDRMVYDRNMIGAVLDFEQTLTAKNVSKQGIDYILKKIVGKVWSARFCGVKLG